jgi:hypothetical protein
VTRTLERVATGTQALLRRREAGCGTGANSPRDYGEDYQEIIRAVRPTP